MDPEVRQFSVGQKRVVTASWWLGQAGGNWAEECTSRNETEIGFIVSGLSPVSQDCKTTCSDNNRVELHVVSCDDCWCGTQHPSASYSVFPSAGRGGSKDALMCPQCGDSSQKHKTSRKTVSRLPIGSYEGVSSQLLGWSLIPTEHVSIEKLRNNLRCSLE